MSAMLKPHARSLLANKRLSVTLVRMNSTKASAPEPIKRETKAEGSPLSQDDTQLLLDRLFRTNKPEWSLTQKNRLYNVQEKNKFKLLDEKLLELQSQPVDFHYYLRSLNDLRSANQLPYKFGSNQMVAGSSEEGQKTRHFLRQIVWEFNAPIRYAFGYGSKVFKQDNVDSSGSQVDMIFAVSYPDHWHSLNLHQYPSHYSGVRLMGSEAVSKIGSWGAGVYFNPFVKMNFERSEAKDNDFELKYGVTSMDNLVDDLTNWSTMYLSGRLQKPVAVVRNAPKISLLEQFNLSSAVGLAVLLLNKSEIKERELYEAIASVSYLGDPRVRLGGENPRKVQNIVSSQFELFRELYLPVVDSYYGDMLQVKSSHGGEHTFAVNMSTEAKAAIISELPKNFRKKLLAKYTAKYESEFSKDLVSQNVLDKLPAITKSSLKPVKSHNELSFLELQDMANDTATRLSEIPSADWEYMPATSYYKTADFVRKVADDSLLTQSLQQSIKETVGRPALVQTLKGVLTAGITNSVKYAWQKKKKNLQGKKQN